MSNPNLAIKWLIALALCWPSPSALLIGGLIVYAFKSGWLKFTIDRTKAPRLHYDRNSR
jgi:hypothetical protein